MFHELRAYLCACAKSLQLYSTLCDPMDCRVLPGSSVHGILQARTLEWVTMPSSRGSSRPRDWTCVSVSPALVGRFFTTSTIWEAPESIYSLSPSTWLEYCLLRGKVFICDGNGWSRRFCVQFLIEVSARPLESTGLSHLPLNPSQLKGLDDITEKRGFICFFVAHQVNDLQPEKYVIRPWHDHRSCYILSCHWQTQLPTWLWQPWSIGFGISFNISPTPSWSSLLTITGLLLFLTASIKLYIHPTVPNTC